MPITPLHFGPALLLKRAAGPRFSLSAFVLSQVLLDIEPGLKLLGLLPEGAGLHVGHTWAVGAGVAVGAAVLGLGLGRVLGLSVCQGMGLRLGLRGQLPRFWIAGLSAAVGVVSHLLLDAVYHADVAASIGLPGLSQVVPPLALDAALLVALVLGLVAMTVSSKRP